jgi:hypothetical protein
MRPLTTRQDFQSAIQRGWVAGMKLLEKTFGLLSKVLEIRPDRQCFRHGTFQLSPVVRNQAASRFHSTMGSEAG